MGSIMHTDLFTVASMFATRCDAASVQAKLPGTEKTGTVHPPSAKKLAPATSTGQATKTDNGLHGTHKICGKVALQNFGQAFLNRTLAHWQQHETVSARRGKVGRRECRENGPNLSAPVLINILLGNPTAVTEAQPSTKNALNLAKIAQVKNGAMGSKDAGAKTVAQPIVLLNHNSKAQIGAQNTQTQAPISADTPQKVGQPGKASAQKTDGASVHAHLHNEAGEKTKQILGLERPVTEAGTKVLKTAKTLPHTRNIPVLNDNRGQLRTGRGDNEHKSVPSEGKTGLDAGKQANYRIADKLVFSESLGGKPQPGVHASGSSSAKLDIVHSQISASQEKSLKDATPKNASPTQPDQVPASANTQMGAPEQSSVVAQAPKSVNNASSHDIAGSISQQIAESVQSSLRQADSQITIHLYPPELGRVYVRFQEQEDQIIGLLEVSKAETRFEIEQQLPQIIRSLQDAGVDIRRFEVLLSDQPERHADSNQSLEQDSPQQQASARQDNQGHDSAGEWLTGMGVDSPQENAEQQMEPINGRVNVLI